MIKVAPSILSADFAAMGQSVSKLEAWGADLVHFDVMDGAFVPNITFGPIMCSAVRPYTKLPIDVHLMVEHPIQWVEPFAEAGADYITIHVEADKHIHRTLQLIHSLGKKGGVVLNPATPVCLVGSIIEDCEMILLMSVNPGAGGQKFIPSVLKKIRELRAMANERGHTLDIQVDGGINPETAKLCVEAGANVLVAGNSVFSAEDPADMIRRIGQR